MPNLAIRSAELSDAEAVAALRKRVDRDKDNKNPPLSAYGGDYPTPRQQQDEIEACMAQGTFWVDAFDQRVIGIAYCFAVYDVPGVYRLIFLVDKEWRAKGIATTLVMRVLMWAKADRSVQSLVCSFHQSHKPARNVLEKFGFVVSYEGSTYFTDTAAYDETEMVLKLR